MASSASTSFFGPVVSFRTHKTDNRPVLVYGDSNSTFSWAGPATIRQATFPSATTFSGAVTLSGAVSQTGNVANTGTWALGASGTSLSAIRVSTFSMVAGTVAPHDSATTTATISLMPADAVIISLQPASQWSGTYYDIGWNAQVSAASTLLVSFRNSTITSVAPALINWTVAYIDPS